MRQKRSRIMPMEECVTILLECGFTYHGKWKGKYGRGMKTLFSFTTPCKHEIDLRLCELRNEATLYSLATPSISPLSTCA